MPYPATWRLPALSALACFLACLLPPQAQAQTYPDKPIRWVVPFPAGGAQDVLTRLIAEPLAKRLKQPVVVENRAGAAGNLGADFLAKAAPDGYTIGILSGVHTANTAFYRKIPFQLDKDFVPVKALGDSAVLIAASPAAPFATPQQFLDHVKANPGKVQMGSTTSLTIDLLKVQTGLDVQLIPYKGAGEALQDLMGGRIDIATGPALQMLPLVKQGRIRALALASTQRIPELPGVPTLAEFVPGYDASMWFGLFAPAGTPAPVIALLSQHLTAILNQAEVREKLAAQGIDPAFSKATPEAIQHRMQTEIARWRRVAVKTGNYAN
nr:tripartite tricarboxylate transporter substrate-binding protein [uncultured Roseateles sp.]